MSVIRYDKLVRDRIPEIIEQDGKTCVTRILTDEEYTQYLEKKLGEELKEYLESKSPEEMADMLEVMRALALARGYGMDRVEEIRIRKVEKRGGFEKKLLLLSVEDSQK